MASGAIELGRWLHRHGRSQVWLAAALRVARVQIWRWLSGSSAPHIDAAARIEKLTGIPARAWARKRG